MAIHLLLGVTMDTGSAKASVSKLLCSSGVGIDIIGYAYRIGN